MKKNNRDQDALEIAIENLKTAPRLALEFTNVYYTPI